MSRRNVETVRRILEAWATGDLRAGADDLDRHVVFVIPPDFPEFGVFVGPDGIRDLMRRFLEQWERFTLEAKHLQAVGDTVLAHVVQHAKGRASGIEGDLSWFMLFTFRAEKVVRMDCVMDEAEALEAVGLKDNVEIVRRAWEAAARRPKPDFATVNALYDPAHELISVMDAIEGGTRRGAQGFREWLTEMGETLESWEASIEDVTGIDHDRVLLVWKATVRGKRSGAPGGQRGAAVMTVRNGKVMRTENYLSGEQALEALGRS